MPRRPRSALVGKVHHVTVRGNNRNTIFFDDEDRLKFLALLERTVEQYDWDVLAYCLMGNHVHLVVRCAVPDLSAAMRYLLTEHTRGYNRRHGRENHLLGRRFHAVAVVSDRHAVALVRYLAHNPVRAGLVRHPAAWKWSSFTALVTEWRPPVFLDADWAPALCRRIGSDLLTVVQGAPVEEEELTIGEILTSDSAPTPAEAATALEYGFAVAEIAAHTGTSEVAVREAIRIHRQEPSRIDYGSRCNIDEIPTPGAGIMSPRRINPGEVLMSDPFGARTPLPGHPGVDYFRISSLDEAGIADTSRLPYTVRALLEMLLRNAGTIHVAAEDVRALANWPATAEIEPAIAFLPARVILQDFTGVPAVVDLAAMRSAMARAGKDPATVDPLVPVDLVIDHSVQVDAFGTGTSYARNIEREYERNGERYALLRWAQGAFGAFRVVPPGMGIVHQVNLEHLGRVVVLRDDAEGTVAIPDTLVGTDSHTTMIDALGILGWGVGGIEAEAVMLGEPLVLQTPIVVGVEFTGALATGVTATDLVLTITERLRKHGVVGKFVEFCGDGLAALSVPDRATLANMAPEYGATAATFPVDAETLRFLEQTGRGDACALVEAYTQAQGMWRADGAPRPTFSETVTVDLSKIVPSVAGPRRPQDRHALGDAPASFRALYSETRSAGSAPPVSDGSVVIAAITSCTNTSNPSVMIAAGLLARNAIARGLGSQPWVKTSLAPGSRVVTDYLQRAGLAEPLDALGFNLVGYGCTTCIGNSGPLPTAVDEAVREGDLAVVAVLSGNRNFEGRIHPLVKASYLASPPLVVAYAIAGSIDVDLTTDPLGTGSDGAPVYLADVWPSAAEVRETILSAVGADQYEEVYARIWDGDDRWRAMPAPSGALFAWDVESTYVQEPPYFADLAATPAPLTDITDARVLAMLGDSVTTDHISPAGSFSADGPAGRYLTTHGVARADFNSFGSRRGNHEVMIRGTFANIRLRNALVPGVEGGVTIHAGSGEQLSIFDAAERYQAEGVPLVVIAGKEYGSGSSRDWAAKGTLLLGVRVVIAESYERIHRSNLVGMGVLPLEFLEGDSPSTLGLTGRELFSIRGVGAITPRSVVSVETIDDDGIARTFQTLARIDGPAEIDYLHHGGILPMVLRRMLAG